MAEPQAPNNGEEIKDEAPDVASRAKQAADGSASASLPIISQKFEKMREGAVSELDKDLIAILERLALADQQTILDSQAASQEERQASPEPPSSDPSATTEALHASSSAAAAATEIDRILPKTDSSEELELFLMTLWELVFLAARAVPYNHTGQNQFVAVLQSLRSRAKTTVTLWGVRSPSVPGMM